MIDFAEKNFLTNLPDKPQWYDGSGLSRYNLFTPRSMVILLDNIYKMVPKERLFSVLPAGGVSGTIRNQYKSTTTPYVYAKTGTLRYNHSLSGFLVTNKGRVLIFSFMHNNFASNVSNIRSAMEKVLLHIRETM
jgi:D-alanyl-D-alanine carboxypeptidase/D-alanyl-D-alanine-endopeptidase (penicillin-binding protein 4)